MVNVDLMQKEVFDHMLETAEGHFFNDKRTNRMKQREHYRYHNAWSKYYYGSEPEKETYRLVCMHVFHQQNSIPFGLLSCLISVGIQTQRHIIRY